MAEKDLVRMRFLIGEVVVDVVVDDDDFELPDFLPGLDLPALSKLRGMLDPEFVDFGRNALKYGGEDSCDQHQ